MEQPTERIWRGVVRDAPGTEIAEMAVVLPLLFMILMGIFWFGQAFRIYGSLAHAAREGARAAVAPVCATCTAASTSPGLIAQTALENDLVAAHMSSNQLVPNSQWTSPVLCQCRSATSSSACTQFVACDGSATSVCVQENVQLSYPSSSQGGMGTCGTSVSARYLYPFHFTIPLTNLDLGKIQLPGQAQMRSETQ
jgi:Flp pilus assembly protein TadG